MAPHNFDPLQKPPPPWPLPPGNIQLSPARSGPFASRNDSHFGEAMNNLQSQVSKIGDSVSAVQEDFNELAERSRYNGEALEKLMLEIKGVREDDGVSRKLTGLARLDKLDDFAQTLNDFANNDFMQRQLDVVTEKIDALQQNFSNDSLPMSLTRELTSLREEMARSNVVSRVDDLHHILTTGKTVVDVDCFRRLEEALAGLQAAESRSDRDTPSPESRELLAQMEGLNLSLSRQEESIKSIMGSSFSRELQGEVRAIQDHLLGAHTAQNKEVKQLNEIVSQQNAELAELRQRIELQTTEQELKSRIETLRQTETELIGHNGELKADLKHHTSRLAELEERYSSLERSLTDMALSKYKGLLGSGSMAVLSLNKNKENEAAPLKIPKRQLRSVSLMDRI